MVRTLFARSIGHGSRGAVAQLLNGLFEVLCRVWLHYCWHTLGWLIIFLWKVDVFMVVRVAVFTSFKSTGGAIWSAAFSTSDLSIRWICLKVELVVTEYWVGLCQLILLIFWRGKLLVSHLDLLHIVWIERLMVGKALCTVRRLAILQMLYILFHLTIILCAFLSLFTRISSHFSVLLARAVRLNLCHCMGTAWCSITGAIWCW